jgi:hypothetical protein
MAHINSSPQLSTTARPPLSTTARGQHRSMKANAGQHRPTTGVNSRHRPTRYVFFSHFFFTYIYLDYDYGQRRPTTAADTPTEGLKANEGHKADDNSTNLNNGQQRPTKTNKGQRRPTRDNENPQQPTRANEGMTGAQTTRHVVWTLRYFFFSS